MKLNRVRTIGGKGAGPEAIQQRLGALAVDAQNRLFVLADGQLKRFAADGTLESQFPAPEAARALDVTDDGLFVGLFGAVQHYDLDGQLVARVADKERLKRVTGIAVLRDHWFVADATQGAIHRYVGRQWQGEVGGDVNTRGFMLPNGVLDIDIDAATESLWVAHPQKHRVEQYSLQGKYIGSFGRFGTHSPADFGGCCNPTNIATGGDGYVVVSEKAPGRVKVFTREGEFVAQSADGVFDESAKNIRLALAGDNRVYATDPRRLAIEVFQLES